MNIPKGYKLVPIVATLEMKNAGWQECERQGFDPEEIEMQTVWTAMHIESTTPPQPIYDEAKEREFFEASIGPTLAQRGAKGGYLYVSTRSAWSGWLACAQSRAKAGKVGHE